MKMMFESQILELIKTIKTNQDELISRMKKLETNINEDYISVFEAAQIKGCSVQNIHYHLDHNFDIEPEKDWIIRGGQKLIKRISLSKIIIKKKSEQIVSKNAGINNSISKQGAASV